MRDCKTGRTSGSHAAPKGRRIGVGQVPQKKRTGRGVTPQAGLLWKVLGVLTAPAGGAALCCTFISVLADSCHTVTLSLGTPMEAKSPGHGDKVLLLLKDSTAWRQMSDGRWGVGAGTFIETQESLRAFATK